MDIPKDYVRRLKEKSATARAKSERSELIGRFVDRINAGRRGTAFPPVTARRINFMLAHLPVKDLYWLFGECEKAEHFSKKFFGVFKGNKTQQPTPDVGGFKHRGSV